jgi:hypothetical protein
MIIAETNICAPALYGHQLLRQVASSVGVYLYRRSHSHPYIVSLGCIRSFCARFVEDWRVDGTPVYGSRVRI